MSRIVLAVALSVAVLVVPASADRFTTQLDGLEAAVQQRQDALPDKLSKSEKKAAKAFKSVLKKLSKDSVSLGGDLKITKAAIKLEKLGDETLSGLLDTALDGFGADLQARLDTAQLRLDIGLAEDPAAKATPAKAQKSITKANDALMAATVELKRKKRVARLLQADKATTKAENLLDKLGFFDTDPGGGGGGGGEGVCGGTPFGPGDAGGGVFGAGAQWTGEEYQAGLAGDQLVVTIFDCDGFGGREYRLVLPATLEPGQYDALATSSSLTVNELGGSGTPILQGMVTITQADTRLQVSYAFNGSITYQGGFSIPMPLPQ